MDSLGVRLHISTMSPFTQDGQRLLLQQGCWEAGRGDECSLLACPRRLIPAYGQSGHCCSEAGKEVQKPRGQNVLLSSWESYHTWQLRRRFRDPRFFTQTIMEPHRAIGCGDAQGFC